MNEISKTAVAVLTLAVADAGYSLPEVIKTSTEQVTSKEVLEAIAAKGGRAGILALATAEGSFAASVAASLIHASVGMLIAARRGEVAAPVIFSEHQKEAAIASGDLAEGDLEVLEEEFKIVMKQIIAANGW